MTNIYHGWKPPSLKAKPATRDNIEALMEVIGKSDYSPERDNAVLALENAVECVHIWTEKMLRTPAQAEADEADKDWRDQVTELRNGG